MATVKQKKFRAVKFRFSTDEGMHYERYMIINNHIPYFRINQWLELKSIKKMSTGKEYAMKLAIFLNWLDDHSTSFEAATNHHVRQFLQHLVFGHLQDEKILSVQSTISSSTLKSYITVITSFYRWLDEINQTEMLWHSKSIRANNSFLYGQIYNYEYSYLVDGYIAMLKPGRDYIKWYDKATKDALCNNFLTLRDEAVLRLTLEGFRIDEVLSITLDSYNATDRIVQPTRSKGRANANRKSNSLRVVALPEKTCNIIDRYIQTERATAETESGRI